jgi:peptidoglycan-associated lipoprotein
MITRKFLAGLFLSLLCTTAAMGQSKLAEEADEAYSKGYFYNAIELYKKAYTVEKKASLKAELIFKVAESYRALGDAEQAEVWYDKANKAQYTDPITYYWIGEMLKQQGKYAEAIAAYNRYKEKKPGDGRADASIAASEMAQKWKDNPTRYDVAPEVLLNSPSYDFAPAFSDKNNQSLVFSSTRQASTGTEIDQVLGENFSDLFGSTRDRLGKWSEPTKLPATINGFGNEGAAVFNSARTIMYFTKCPMEKKKVYGCDIWMSKKVGNNYSEPEMLALKPNADKNDTTTVGHPTLSPDDQFMIFSSNVRLQGHQGGMDLYIVKLNEEGKPVGQATNLGPDINTRKAELFPHWRQDGSLYFASNGYPSMGGMDMYRAEPTGDNKWGQVENLKAPLNSAWDDFGIIFDGENDRGFFTTNRPGGKGQDDIWRFYMPDMVFALQGVAYDKLSGQPIANAKISVVGTDGSNFSALTDDNGGFEFAESGTDRFIKESTSYSILAEADGYLVVKDQVTTVGLSESTTFVKEYFLQPARPDIVINLPEVQYDLGKYALRPEGKDSLEVLYQTMIDNPTIIIELAAHTDTRGSEASNDILSQNRAQSCVNYLVTRGIDPARMVAKGYGERKPRISDAEIAKMKTKEEQEAAHQQNRRTEFRVLSWDFQPKEGDGAPQSN